MPQMARTGVMTRAVRATLAAFVSSRILQALRTWNSSQVRNGSAVQVPSGHDRRSIPGIHRSDSGTTMDLPADWLSGANHLFGWIVNLEKVQQCLSPHLTGLHEITISSSFSRSSPTIISTARLSTSLPRRGYRPGDKANSGSVWETRVEILSDNDPGPQGLWRINQEASRYHHVAMWPALVRQMLLPAAKEGSIVLDPFAGSGTTGEVAVSMGLKAILIESSQTALRALKDRISRCTEKTLFS